MLALCLAMLGSGCGLFPKGSQARNFVPSHPVSRADGLARRRGFLRDNEGHVLSLQEEIDRVLLEPHLGPGK